MAAPSEKNSTEMESRFQPPLNKEKVKEAATALVDYVKKKGSKDILLGDDGIKIGLQLSFKKAPKSKNSCIKIPLPHSIMTPTNDVCLFVKDVDPTKREYDDTINHFKDILAEKGVTTITSIIPVKSLKTEYKQYEAKRNLSNMYDIYLADARVVGILPKMLGKNFYGKRKHPIQVNLLAKNLSAEIDSVINNTRMHLTGRGTSCLTTVANTTMSVDDIAENAFAAANHLAGKIPGGPDNVQQLFLTSRGAPSLPIFLSTDAGEKVVLPVKKKVIIEDEPEDVTTVEGAKVKVNRRYDVILVKDGEDVPDEKKIRNKKRKMSTKVAAEPVNKKKRKPVEASIVKGKSKYTLVKQPKRITRKSSA